MFEDEKGISWPNKFQAWWYNLTGFCGCGDPTSVILLVKRELERMELPYEDPKRGPDKEDYNNPLKYLLWYWLDQKKLTEHGGSVLGSWVKNFPDELRKSEEEITRLMEEKF